MNGFTASERKRFASEYNRIVEIIVRRALLFNKYQSVPAALSHPAVSAAVCSVMKDLAKKAETEECDTELMYGITRSLFALVTSIQETDEELLNIPDEEINSEVKSSPLYKCLKKQIG